MCLAIRDVDPSVGVSDEWFASGWLYGMPCLIRCVVLMDIFTFDFLLFVFHCLLYFFCFLLFIYFAIIIVVSCSCVCKVA